MTDDVRAVWNACGEAFDRFTEAEDSFSKLIERPAVDQLLGDLAGLRLLDLGCGSGVHSLRFAQSGADVVGVDISEKMIELARRAASDRGTRATFQVSDISMGLPFNDEEFDVVFTSTALHYVRDLPSAFAEAARVLKPEGRIVVSVLHPMATARFPIAGPAESPLKDWETRTSWPVNYLGPARREIQTPWQNCADVPPEGSRLQCNHHTVAAYLAALLSADLSLEDLLEPAPPTELQTLDPVRYEEATAIPPYLILLARKLGPGG
jgi:ubiquinone/menaquinone biosynthesis C-methylase UbiE